MTNAACHYLIKGRVQGVCYRASTVKKAKELALTGWVRNLSDGGVEVFACGDVERLKQLQDWLWQGPPAAKVEQVDCKAAPWQEVTGFEIK